MKMKCDLKSVSVGLLAIVFFAAAFNPVFGVSADMKSSYTDLSSLDNSVVKLPFPLAVLSDTTNLIDKSIPHMKITNEKFGLLILDLSTYQEKTYQSKDLYTGFTIHGDITNGTTISMRSSHLLSLDK